MSFSVTTQNLNIVRYDCKVNLPSDLDCIVGWLNDPEVVKFSEQKYKTHTRASQEAYIESLSDDDLYLCLFVGSAFIGTMTVHVDPNNKIANMGILIGDKYYWGRGLGYEAWRAVCNELLHKKIVRRVEAGCMSCNTYMIKVCETSGMKCEASVPNHFLYHGVPMDLLLWGRER